MEQEEDAVELGDFITDRIDLSFFGGDSVEDEFFFFEPLFEKQLVSWGFSDLMKWV